MAPSTPPPRTGDCTVTVYDSENLSVVWERVGDWTPTTRIVLKAGAKCSQVCGTNGLSSTYKTPLAGPAIDVKKSGVYEVENNGAREYYLYIWKAAKFPGGITKLDPMDVRPGFDPAYAPLLKAAKDFPGVLNCPRPI